MEKDFKIEKMRKLWSTPKSFRDSKIDLLFNRALKPFGDHPIVLFQDLRTGDYFFLTFRTNKDNRKPLRGEMKIAKEINNLQDVDAFLDTTHIHWASQELFESVFDKEEINYITNVFSKEVSFEIFRKVYKNINEEPPFVSLMKLEMNENNQIVPNLLYCNEILYKMAWEHNSSFNSKMEKEMIQKNEDNKWRIDKIGNQVYSEGMWMIAEIDEENPNYILRQRRKMFPNVKNDSILPALEKGQEIFEDTKLRPAYFERIQEKESWLVSNYGEDWEKDYGFYEQYKEFAEFKKETKESQEQMEKPKLKKQSSRGMKM